MVVNSHSAEVDLVPGKAVLDKINAGNVKKLKLAWSSATGSTEGHQSPPIVNNGYMYVTTPNAQVIALNAATGQEIWRFKHELPADLLMLHNTNRGVALYGDKVYVATVDSNLFALDATTGKVVWKATVGDVKALSYITLAPLAAKGKIMVGSSGGETGIRGFVAAFDANTGKEAWRTYTTAAPGEPGSGARRGGVHHLARAGAAGRPARGFRARGACRAGQRRSALHRTGHPPGRRRARSVERNFRPQAAARQLHAAPVVRRRIRRPQPPGYD